MSRENPPKAYDRDYFDRWYRRRGSRIEAPAELRRRVALAVALAERHLGRPVRTVLDVGCGEGRWCAELLRLRPTARYTGVDPSPYVVERFGRSRGLLLGGFGEIGSMPLAEGYDLVVCADVLHYVPDAELGSGLAGLVARMRGLGWLEALCREDEVEGDLRGLILRPVATYRRRFRALGLTHAGAHGWLAPRLAERPTALERS